MRVARSGRGFFVSRGHFLSVCVLLTASAFVLRPASIPVAALTSGFCAVAIALVTIAGFVGASWTEGNGERRVIYAGTLSFATLIAIATGNGGSVAALSALTAIAVVAVVLEWYRSSEPYDFTEGRRVAGTVARSPAGIETVDHDLESRLIARLGGEVPTFRIHAEEEEPPEEREATFRLERGFQDGDAEWVEGIAQVEFAPGRKQTLVHIPFWPPLGSIPAVEFEVLGEADVHVSSGGRYRWGIRLEAQRSGSADAAESVEIAFFLTAHRARGDAA